MSIHRQLLEACHKRWRSTTVIFLCLKGAFDSADHIALFSAFHGKSKTEKLVKLLPALYIHTHGRVRIYSETSSSFETMTYLSSLV